MNIISELKYIDIFPEETSFLVEGKKNFRTWTGVTLSILVIIASIILTIMFGQEVYQRKRPSVSSSEQYLSTSTVNLTEWPFFIIISDYDGNKIENVSGYYDIKPFKMNFTEDGYSDFANDTVINTVKKNISIM